MYSETTKTYMENKELRVEFNYDDIETLLVDKDGYKHVLSLDNYLFSSKLPRFTDFSTKNTKAINELITLMQESDYEIVDIKQEPTFSPTHGHSYYIYHILTTITYK